MCKIEMCWTVDAVFVVLPVKRVLVQQIFSYILWHTQLDICISCHIELSIWIKIQPLLLCTQDGNRLDHVYCFFLFTETIEIYILFDTFREKKSQLFYMFEKKNATSNQKPCVQQLDSVYILGHFCDQLFFVESSIL